MPLKTYPLGKARGCRGCFSGIQEILICFGGSDASCFYEKSFLAAISWRNKTKNYQVKINIALPKLPPNFAKFAADVQSNVNCELHVGLHNLSTLYQKASICIGSGGVMLWERCLFGLPSIVIPIVDDQKTKREAVEYHWRGHVCLKHSKHNGRCHTGCIDEITR